MQIARVPSRFAIRPDADPTDVDQARPGRCRPVVVAALALAALATLLPAPVRAYSEDVCYFRVQSTDGTVDPDRVYAYPFNCFDLECLDGGELSSQAGRCAVAGLAQYLAVTLGGQPDQPARIVGHSSLHFDALFLLARIAGLAEDQALRLATAAEATDLGSHRSLTTPPTGPPPLTASLAAADPESNLEGLARTNSETDGFWLHYVPWHGNGRRLRHALTVGGYKAYLRDPTATTVDDFERSLFHLRDWAWAVGGERPLCKLGLLAADGSCASGGAYVASALLADVLVDDGVAALGVQSTRQDEDGGYDPAATSALSGSVEALGVYLHALGDRLSHEACLRDAPLEAESGSVDDACGAGTTYQYALRFTEECGQVTHALRHYLETGHEEATPPRTLAGLELSIRELAEWAIAHQLTPASPRGGMPPLLIDGKLNEAFVRRMVGTAERPGRLTEAIGEPCANRRLAALCSLARDGYGVGWYDGNEPCTFPTFPGDSQCGGPEAEELEDAPSQPQARRRSSTPVIRMATAIVP